MATFLAFWTAIWMVAMARAIVMFGMPKTKLDWAAVIASYIVMPVFVIFLTVVYMEN